MLMSMFRGLLMFVYIYMFVFFLSFVFLLISLSGLGVNVVFTMNWKVFLPLWFSGIVCVELVLFLP